MSPRATGSAAEETQYRFGFIFTRRIDLFGLFFFFTFVNASKKQWTAPG